MFNGWALGYKMGNKNRLMELKNFGVGLWPFFMVFLRNIYARSDTDSVTRLSN